MAKSTAHEKMTAKGTACVSLAALVVMLPGLALARAAAVEPMLVTQSVQATEGDIVPTRTYSSPVLAIDPKDHRTVVAAAFEMRTRRCVLLRSTDAGATWALLDSSPSPDAYPFCTHISGKTIQNAVAFGRDSSLYYALNGWDVKDGGPRQNMSVLVARSTNLGDSWTTTKVRDARGLEGERIENNRSVSALAVDSTAGGQDVVYVGWRTSNPEAKPASASRPMLAVSTDGAGTFSEPIDVTGDFFASEEVRARLLGSTPPSAAITAANFGGDEPQLAISDRGTLNVLWQLQTVGIRPEPKRPLYMSTSTDGGKTFTVREVIPEVTTLSSPVLRWSPSGGQRGSLHLLYGRHVENVDQLLDIYYQRSVDGGQTWSKPVRMTDDDPSKLIGKDVPNLSVAPGGRLEAVWWDFRRDPGSFANDVYLAVSTDDGVTWAKNVRVTDRSINRKIGPWATSADISQPPGIASTGAYTIVGWDDTRNGDTVTQSQDIYTANLQYSLLSSSGPSSAILYTLAGFGGLIGGSLALWMVARMARRVGSRRLRTIRTRPAE